MSKMAYNATAGEAIYYLENYLYYSLSSAHVLALIHLYFFLFKNINSLRALLL